MKIKVIMPKWWTDGELVFGWTDAVDTKYSGFWFVDVPELGCSGYFLARDLARA